MGSQAVNIGKLDRRIAFKSQSQERDGYGHKVNSWIDEFTTWASMKPVSDGENFGSGQVKAFATHRFTIRHASNSARISPTWILIFDNSEFEISGIKEIEGRLKFLEITATKRAENG